MAELTTFIKDILESKKVTIPENWVKLYPIIFEQDAAFLRMQTVVSYFMNMHSITARVFAFQREQIERECHSAILYFRDIGLLLFYDNVPGLRELVFHKPKFILKLLKSTFHHDLKRLLNYDNSKDLQSRFKRTELTTMLSQYLQDGLLSKKLLQTLWYQCDLQENDTQAFIELLQAFSLCYPISDECETFFLPWFVQNNTCSEVASRKHLNMFGENKMSVHYECKFITHIPQNVFEITCVQLQKTATERKYLGERYSWKDGLQIKIGNIACVLKRNIDSAIISFSVCGSTQDGHVIWQIMGEVHADFSVSLKPYDGVLEDFYFLCNHCILTAKQTICKLTPEATLQTGGPNVSFLTCNNEEVPRGLIRAFNDKQQGDVIKNINIYLENVFSEMAVPGKVLYLDCKVVTLTKFQISWVWSLVSEEEQGDTEVTQKTDVVDPTIKHAVIEYTDGSQTKRVAVKRPPFVSEGEPKIFRVAAVNKNGTGEFQQVVPSLVVQGEDHITDEDLVTLKDNHGSFIRMSSSWQITMTMFKRGAINDKVKEGFSIRYRENGPQSACVFLMEAVYRMKYKHLFCFKKALMETGQTVLAETVPAQEIPLVETDVLQQNLNSSDESVNRPEEVEREEVYDRAL